MSAHIVYDSAPLGSLIRYFDGTPKPPARFRKKLSVWESRNGAGRLVRKEPPRPRATYSSPAHFTLHEGDFGEGGTIVVSVRRTYSVESDLRFEIVEHPAIGMVRVLQDLGDSPNSCISPGIERRPNAGLPAIRTAEPVSRRSPPTKSAPTLSRVARPPDPFHRIESIDDGPGIARAIAGSVPFHGDRHVRLDQELLL